MNTHLEVLLVEDNVLDADILEAVVHSSNLEKPKLTHAKRFTDALSMLSEKAYDLILLDLYLQEGKETCLLTKLQQRAPKIPIVVITDFPNETVAVKALQKGAQDYVIKENARRAERLAKLGTANVGNWLVRRIHNVVKSAKLTHQKATENPYTHITKREKDNGLWSWNLATDDLYCSPKWKVLLGTYDHVASNHINDWFSRIHPEDRLGFQRILKDYLNHHPKKFSCEYRIKHANGNYLWVLAQGQALWDKEGVAYWMMGHQTDITTQKQKKQASTTKTTDLTPTVINTVGDELLTIQANLYSNRGMYEEAEPLLQEALGLQRALLGNDHPNVGITLYNLASLYDNLFRFQEAESYFQESLSLFQKKIGPKHAYTQKVKRKVDMICRLNTVMIAHRKEGPHSSSTSP